MYKAYITYVKNIRPAENSDFLNACEVFGNTTIIDKTITEDTLVLYLPSDGQISIEFGEKNNLFRKKDDAGNNIGGFIDPVKRNIIAIRLRGNRSDGLVLPISCLDYCYSHNNASSEFCAGDVIDGIVNGHEICCKYIPRSNHRTSSGVKGNKVRKKKINVAPLFVEHADTEQLAYNLGAFKPGDEIEITLKMHGTSQRTGYLPIRKEGVYSYTSLFKAALHKLIPVRKWRNAFGEKYGVAQYEYDYISGTRRTVLEDYDGGFYGSNEFRKQHHDKFVGKLRKGETVYYEVVGFTHTGAPIMADGNNKKVGKDFVKLYGDTTTFSYGCEKHMLVCDDTDGRNQKVVGQSDIYVYRMTMTNEDGDVVEYSPNFMRYRCEQMGIKCVPVLWKGTIPYAEWESAGNYVVIHAERYYDGSDPIGKTHVREGVVVRILNRPSFTAYKHKNYNFKVLSDIIKEEIVDSDKLTDMSEDMISEL